MFHTTLKGELLPWSKGRDDSGPGSGNPSLRALRLHFATAGLGKRWLFSQCLFSACRHTCTGSKSAAVLASELGRVVRRKDVMGFETKTDVQLQPFFLQLPILICIKRRGLGLMRHSRLNSRILFTGRSELLLVFFFFLFSYCGYSM